MQITVTKHSYGSRSNRSDGCQTKIQLPLMCMSIYLLVVSNIYSTLFVNEISQTYSILLSWQQHLTLHFKIIMVSPDHSSSLCNISISLAYVIHALIITSYDIIEDHEIEIHWVEFICTGIDAGWLKEYSIDNTLHSDVFFPLYQMEIMKSYIS